MFKQNPILDKISDLIDDWCHNQFQYNQTEIEKLRVIIKNHIYNDDGLLDVEAFNELNSITPTTFNITQDNIDDDTILIVTTKAGKFNL